LLALEQAGGAGLLVERMAAGELELVVAAHREGVVPALAVGLGGVWTEALDDVAILPLPVSSDQVEQALRSLAGAPLLTGGRGRAPLDLPAAADLAARVGALLIEAGLQLVELNPVLVGRSGEGAIALDAVVSR
jgi:hypothetical protein